MWSRFLDIICCQVKEEDRIRLNSDSSESLDGPDPNKQRDSFMMVTQGKKRSSKGAQRKNSANRRPVCVDSSCPGSSSNQSEVVNGGFIENPDAINVEEPSGQESKFYCDFSASCVNSSTPSNIDNEVCN